MHDDSTAATYIKHLIKIATTPVGCLYNNYVCERAEHEFPILAARDAARVCHCFYCLPPKELPTAWLAHRNRVILACERFLLCMDTVNPPSVHILNCRNVKWKRSQTWTEVARLQWCIGRNICPHFGVIYMISMPLCNIYRAAKHMRLSGILLWKSLAVDPLHFFAVPRSFFFFLSSVIMIYTSPFQLSIVPFHQPSGAPSPQSWVHC